MVIHSSNPQCPSDRWIDLHAHILAGVDDGPATMEQSLAMAGVAQADGIGCMVATPHSVDWPASREDVRRSVEELNQAVRLASLSVVILPGIEAYMAPDLPAQVRAGAVFPLADSVCVLVELPAGAYPLYTEQVIFELQVMGLSIVLAHPERNAVLQEAPDKLIPLVQRGVLVQLTAGSLVGDFGPAAERTAESLLERNLAHLIASDAHDACYRTPRLSEAVEIAADIAGRPRALAMVTDAPRAVLNNERVELPAPARKKRFWTW